MLTTPYGRMMGLIETPSLRFIVALIIGVVLLLPLLVWTILQILFVVLTEVFIRKPVEAYKGEFE